MMTAQGKAKTGRTDSQCGFCGCVALSKPSNGSFALTSMSFRPVIWRFHAHCCCISCSGYHRTGGFDSICESLQLLCENADSVASCLRERQRCFLNYVSVEKTVWRPFYTLIFVVQDRVCIAPIGYVSQFIQFHY